jgi:hypothetical protein
MAHFAEIDSNNQVLRVLVVSNDDEHRGQEFLAEELGLGGTWIQTSYNNNIRKQFAGVGYSYNETADVFIALQPFESWTLDENHDWQPPTPRPDGDFYWDEDDQQWVEIEIPEA